MKTRQDALLNFMGAPATQLLIPVYQRRYAWSTRQCDVLWDDIMRAGSAGSAHFLGTVLFAEESCEGSIERRLDIIDGQQRMVTCVLLLTALRDYLAQSGLDIDGVDAAVIDERYLHIDGQAKIQLSRTDRLTMEAVLNKGELPGEDELSTNVLDNFRHFAAKLEQLDAAALCALWRGMNLLLVLLAQMDDDDRPQFIFESLNAKGMPLTTADLVRNLLLVNASLEDQNRLYKKYWEPIERLYGDEEGDTRLNAALHGWLAVTAPKLRVKDKDRVYSAFKLYLDTVENRSLEEILIGLKGFCETFAIKSAAAAKKPAQADYDTLRSGQLISSKKLFGS